MIIGSGTAVPHSGRGAPGCVVKVGGEDLIFDLGPGTVHRWPDAGVSILDVTDVHVSHLHPDHTTDVVTLLFALKNQYLKRVKPLRITGPPGLKDFHRGLLRAFGAWVESDGYELELKEIEEEVVERGSYRLISRKVIHTDSSLGYRIETPEGKVAAYSGDTDNCRGILELGQGADLMLLECSFPEENRIEGHLTPTLAGEIAAACGARKLVLTHFYPLLEGVNVVDRIRKVYGGEIIMAEDMMAIEV